MSAPRTLRVQVLGQRFRIVTVYWVQVRPSRDWDEELEPLSGGQLFNSREACERAIAALTAPQLAVAA